MEWVGLKVLHASLTFLGEQLVVHSATPEGGHQIETSEQLKTCAGKKG